MEKYPSFTDNNLSEKERESKRRCQMMHEASEHGRMNAALFFLERTERFRGVGHANNSSAENVQPVFSNKKERLYLYYL